MSREAGFESTDTILIAMPIYGSSRLRCYVCLENYRDLNICLLSKGFNCPYEALSLGHEVVDRLA